MCKFCSTRCSNEGANQSKVWQEKQVHLVICAREKIGKIKENITDTFTVLRCGNKTEYEKCLHTNNTFQHTVYSRI